VGRVVVESGITTPGDAVGIVTTVGNVMEIGVLEGDETGDVVAGITVTA
jgi:hypothetical protein